MTTPDASNRLSETVERGRFGSQTAEQVSALEKIVPLAFDRCRLLTGKMARFVIEAGKDTAYNDTETSTWEA